MAHQLTMVNGKAQMFSVRQTPWHGLGHIVNEAPSAEEAIKLAGLNWTVEKKQIYFNLPNLGSNHDFKSVPEYNALVKSDDHKVLSVMKKGYEPLQNEKAFSFFNPFIESGLASFETAGSLREGKVIWVLATLNKAPIDVGGGDFVKKNLLLSNSHDGTLAVRVGFTPVRVVCNNTLSSSHSNKDSQLLRIKHSSKVAENLDKIQEIVNAMDAKFEATAEQYKYLSTRMINQKDLEHYINIIFELNPNGTDREKLRNKKMQETITNLFENGAGQHLKSAKGTFWGAYNAVTEYLTHESGKEADKRLYNNWYGDLMRKNNEALFEAVEMAGG